MSYFGYCENLPIKAGDKVHIKTGTLLKHYKTGVGLCKSKRDQVITVHHTLPGSSFFCGILGRDGAPHYHFVSSYDRYYCQETFGSDDLEKLTQYIVLRGTE